MFRRKASAVVNQETQEPEIRNGKVITAEMRRCSHTPLVAGKSIDTVLNAQADGTYICSRCGQVFTADEKKWLETEYQLKNLVMDFASA